MYTEMWEGGSIFLMKYDSRLSGGESEYRGIWGGLGESRDSVRERVVENENGRKDGCGCGA